MREKLSKEQRDRLPPPAPGAWPVIGNIPQFMRAPLRFMIEAEQHQGPIYWLESPIRLVCVVNEPEYVKYILQENHRHYIKSFGYDALRLLLGEGLLTSEGDFWLRQRRLAQPAFHRERLQQLVQLMGDTTIEWIENIKKNQPNGGELDVTQFVNTLTLAIVARSMFSTEMGADEMQIISTNLSYTIEQGANRIRNPFKLPFWVPTPTNFKERKALAAIEEVVMKMIENRMADTKRYNDLLDMLIHTEDEETGERMNLRQLRDEVMTIFIAGHETTANALNFAFYALHKNPEVLNKVLGEIAYLQGKAPGFDDLKKLVYTRAVIDETLRMYPPAWVMGRKSTRVEQFGTFEIPAGTTMAIPIYVLHHSSRIWKNPEQFDPGRFLADRQAEIPKYAYFPFGGGPRQCIGNNFALYEMVIVVASFLQHIQYAVPDYYQLELMPLITLRSRDNIPLSFTWRA